MIPVLLGGAENFDRYMGRCVDFTSANYGGNAQIDGPTGLVAINLCSACMWLYSPQLNTGDFDVMGPFNGVSFGGLGPSSESVLAVFTDAGGYSQTDLPAYPTGQWFFVGFSSSPTAAVGYQLVSGASSMATATVAPVTGSGTAGVIFGIGAFGGDPNMPMYAAGFKLWGRILSQTEMQAEAQQLAPVSQRGLKAYLPMRAAANVLADSFVPGSVYTGGAPFVTRLLAPPVPEVLVPHRLVSL